MSPPILAMAVLSAFSPMRSPATPPVQVVVVSSDTLLVQSSYPIMNTFVADHYERYSYFVEYSADGCKAKILLRTNRPSLRLVVELGSEETGRRSRHVIVTKNPRER